MIRAVAGLAAFSVVATTLAACRRRVVLVTVRGTSMAPTFADGERIPAVRRSRYRVGDVIVFDVPAAADPPWRIKRVAAVAGDPVPAWLDAPGSLVPAACVVVAGDNPVSQDSRQLGFIPVCDVRGRVGRSARCAAAHARQP